MGGIDVSDLISRCFDNQYTSETSRINSRAGSPKMERQGRLKVACLTVLVVMWCNATCASAWGWLMAGNWSSTHRSFALPYNATYCVRLPFAKASMPLQLHRCVGVRFWEEQFSSDDGALLVLSTNSEGLHSCLDVEEGGTRVGLRDCDPASPSQRWGFHGTKLQNVQGLFLMAPAPLAPHAADVPLFVVGELDDNIAGTSDWTFVDSSYLGDDSSKPILPSSRSANLVRNELFQENWGESQPEGAPGDMTLSCGWTILDDSTTAVVRNPSGGWNVILGAISQTVPTYPGLPHTLKFNVKVNDTCGNGDDPAATILVSLLPSSSASNVIDVDSNGGLWKAEELRFMAVDNTVNLIFANIGGEHSRCSVTIGNVEVGLEDDYLIFEAADKLWMRVLCLYALVAIFGVLALALLVVHVVGSLKSRKLK